jgi:hypothetical protein
VLSAVSALVRTAPASPDGELASRLLLLGLVLRPAGSWSARALIVAAASIALLDTRLVRTPALWLGLAALLGLRLVVDWPLSDNHAYLTAYWCLAIGLAYFTAAPRRGVTLAARQLLALTFALAVVWKAFLSPDYVDERFFRVTLLRDRTLHECRHAVHRHDSRGHRLRPRSAHASSARNRAVRLATGLRAPSVQSVRERGDLGDTGG